jgi:hypothetical protein
MGNRIPKKILVISPEENVYLRFLECLTKEKQERENMRNILQIKIFTTTDIIIGKFDCKFTSFCINLRFPMDVGLLQSIDFQRHVYDCYIFIISGYKEPENFYIDYINNYIDKPQDKIYIFYDFIKEQNQFYDLKQFLSLNLYEHKFIYNIADLMKWINSIFLFYENPQTFKKQQNLMKIWNKGWNRRNNRKFPKKIKDLIIILLFCLNSEKNVPIEIIMIILEYYIDFTVNDIDLKERSKLASSK